MDYNPKPLDSSAIALSREISELSELLARNVHENWARLRIGEGWHYGPNRNDTRKEHPGLVPFEELSDSERAYDYEIAHQTIKSLLALGYSIQPPAGVAVTSHSAGASEGLGVARLLGDAVNNGHAALQSLWRAHDPAAWSQNPEVYRVLAKRVLKLGEPLFAYDIVAEGIKHFPNDVVLRQILSLALARSGAAASANAVLSGLYEEGHRDEETLGLLARTQKNLAFEASHAEQAEFHLRQAFDIYRQAFRGTGGYWSGVNAATMALLLHEREQAVSLARQVAGRCRAELARGDSDPADRYWILSTLGEAALLVGDWAEAEDWYTQAVQLGRGDWGSLQSTLHNARLLLRHLRGDEALIERVFQYPSVVVFAGHMIDRPDRQIPRFPQQLEAAVKRAIRARLDKCNAGFGYASAACGSDVLFHEAILERKGECHVVLPYEVEAFKEDSVAIVPEGNWSRRCDAIIAAAVEVKEASKRSQICGRVSYVFANLMLHGLASVQAHHLETKLIPMVVWDGLPGDGPDGTAGTIDRWQRLGLQTEIIDLREIIARECPNLPPNICGVSVTSSSRRRGSANSEFSSEIRALLFADAHGFSELTDEEVPRFVQHFLGLAGKLSSDSPYKPLMKNTWGDGLYFVFSSVHDAGHFALDLRDGVTHTDWPKLGLPKLNLRIGLHAGPVYSCTDPVTQRISYMGAHVSRAARIEPVTPTGQVYASQDFAALAAAEGVTDFRCDYVGQTPMAKKYGTFPTYVVHRATKNSSNSV